MNLIFYDFNLWFRPYRYLILFHPPTYYFSYTFHFRHIQFQKAISLHVCWRWNYDKDKCKQQTRLEKTAEEQQSDKQEIQVQKLLTVPSSSKSFWHKNKDRSMHFVQSLKNDQIFIFMSLHYLEPYFCEQKKRKKIFYCFWKWFYLYNTIFSSTIICTLLLNFSRQ